MAKANAALHEANTETRNQPQFTNIEGLSAWLQAQPNVTDRNSTPYFTYQGIVMGYVCDTYNDHPYHRLLYVYERSLVDSEHND